MKTNWKIAFFIFYLGQAFSIIESEAVQFAIIFLKRIGSTFHMTAMQAAIPQFVPQDYLTKAGAWGNFIESGGQLIAPMSGSVLMECIPIFAVLFVDIIGAAFAVVCLLLIKISDIPQRSEKKKFFGELKKGFYVLKSNKLLTVALSHLVLVGIVYLPLASLFPFSMLSHYKKGAVQNGFVYMIFLLSMLIFSFLLEIWGGSKKRFIMTSLSTIIIGLCAAIIGALPASFFISCAAFIFLLGGDVAFFNAPYLAYVQESYSYRGFRKGNVSFDYNFYRCKPYRACFLMPIKRCHRRKQPGFILSGILLAFTGLVCLLKKMSVSICKILYAKIALVLNRH